MHQHDSQPVYDPDNGSGQKLGYCSGNVEQFVQDVKILLDDEEMRKALGQRAQEFAWTHFLPEPIFVRLNSSC
jgi:hypothetical protein